MISDVIIPGDNESLLAFHAANPDAIPDTIKRVQQMEQMELRVVPANTANQGRVPAVFSSKNAVFPIPVGMNRSVVQLSTYSGTAGANYVQATIQALMDSQSATVNKINELLQQLAAANINPR